MSRQIRPTAQNMWFFTKYVFWDGIAKIGASLLILSADRNMLISAIPPQEFRFLHFAFRARRD